MSFTRLFCKKFSELLPWIRITFLLLLTIAVSIPINSISWLTSPIGQLRRPIISTSWPTPLTDQLANKPTPLADQFQRLAYLADPLTPLLTNSDDWPVSTADQLCRLTNFACLPDAYICALSLLSCANQIFFSHMFWFYVLPEKYPKISFSTNCRNHPENFASLSVSLHLVCTHQGPIKLLNIWKQPTAKNSLKRISKF